MRLLLALLCDDAAVNPEGKLDIHGVFTDLFAPGFPARQDRVVLVLVIEWDREDEGRFTFRVDLVAPDGKPTMTVSGHTDVDRRPADRPPARTQLVMPLETVIFPSAGAYRFMVRVKGRELEGPTLHLIHQPRT
jgi:hypothetical protein